MELSFISPAELEELKAQPHLIAQKAQTKINELSTALETIKAEREADSTNNEQLIHQLESQRVSLSQEVERLKKDNDVLRKEMEGIRSTNDAFAKEVPQLRKALTEKDDRHLAVHHSVERLMAEKKHALGQLERAEKETEELQAEITKLNSQLKDSFIVKSDYQARISELEAVNATNQFQITRLQQEREMLEKFVGSANEEVNKKLEELRELRKTTGARIVEVDTKNSELEEALSRANTEVHQLRTKVSTLEQKLSLNSAELKSLTDEKQQLKEQNQFEINEKLKLSDKIILERKHTHAQIVSLQTQVGNLQQDLKNADTNLETTQAELDRTVSELARAKRELEKEKVNSNSTSLLASPTSSSSAQFTPQSPAAIPTLTLASRLTIDEVLSKNDSTSLKRELRQMVSLYDDLSKLLLTERNEHRRLSASFTILVKEVKEKAPIMAQQRKEHERILSEYNILVHQAGLSKQRAEELEVQLGLSSAETSRLQNHAAILEEQLQALLQQESRDELQGQYHNTRELVQAVSFWKQRVLELEEQQSSNSNGGLEMASKLEQAMKELNELKNSRQRQMDMMNDYIAKRNSYQVLSQSLQTDRSKFMLPPEEPSSAGDMSHDAGNTSTLASNELYQELKREFDEYKKEQSKSYSTLEQQLDQARASESEAKVNLAKAQSEAKYLAERYKSTSEDLQNSTVSYDHLRKKIDDYSTLVIHQQKTIDDLTSRRIELESSLMTLNATLEATKAELTIRKSSEDRFMSECSSISIEKGKLLAQIDNMREMQSAAETLAFGERQKLETKLLVAQQEVSKAKSIAETERKHLYATISSHENRLAELQTQLAAAQKELAEAREAYGRTKATEESLSKQLSDAKSAQQHSEAKLTRLLDNSANPTEAAETNRLELELSLAKADAANSASLLQAEKEQTEQYKIRYEAAEAQLSKSLEESTKLQEELTARIAALDERAKTDEVRTKELESQLQNVTTKNSEDRAESEKRSADALSAISARDELQARIQVLENHEAALLSEIQVLKKEVENAQKNYQHELVAHAGDIQRLESIEKELAAAKTQLVDLKAKSAAEKQGYETREASWRDTQQHLQQQVKELEERLTALKSENESLHKVAESMTALSNKLQQQYMDPLLLATSDLDAATTNPTFAEHDKVLADMREVVRYLRQENSMLDLKCETLVQEKIMSRQEIEELKRAKTAALEQAQLERERSRTSFRTEEDHRNLMEQVQQLNLLRESNILLREDANRASAQLQEAKATIQSLNDQLGPALEEKRANIAKIETLEAELQTRNTEIKHHRVRIQKLLDKYESIEPEEHHKLKEDFAASSKQVTELKETIEKLEASCAQLTEQNTKLQAQSKLGKQSSRDLATLKQSLEEKEKAKAELEQKLATAQETLQTTTAQLADSEKKVRSAVRMHTAKKKEWDAEQVQLVEQTQILKTEIETLKSEISTLKAENATIKTERDKNVADNKVLEFRLKALEKRNATPVTPATPAAPVVPTPAPAKPTPTTPAKVAAVSPPAAKAPALTPTPPTPTSPPAKAPAATIPTTPTPPAPKPAAPTPATSIFGSSTVFGGPSAFSSIPTTPTPPVAPTPPTPTPRTISLNKKTAKAAAQVPPTTTPSIPVTSPFYIPPTSGSIFGTPTPFTPAEPVVATPVEKEHVETEEEKHAQEPSEHVDTSVPPTTPPAFDSEMGEERDEGEAEESESAEAQETQHADEEAEAAEEEHAEEQHEGQETADTMEDEGEEEHDAEEESGETAGENAGEAAETEEGTEETEEQEEATGEGEATEEGSGEHAEETTGESHAEETGGEGENEEEQQQEEEEGEEEQEEEQGEEHEEEQAPEPVPAQQRTKRIKLHPNPMFTPPTATTPPPSPPPADPEFSLEKKEDAEEEESTPTTTTTTTSLPASVTPPPPPSLSTPPPVIPTPSPTPPPPTSSTPAAPPKRTINLRGNSSTSLTPPTQLSTPLSTPLSTSLSSSLSTSLSTPPLSGGRGRGRTLNRNFSLNNNLLPTPPSAPPAPSAKEWRGGQKRTLPSSSSSLPSQAPPKLPRPNQDPPSDDK